MTKYSVRCSQTGEVFEDVETLEEAQNLIEKFLAEDREDSKEELQKLQEEDHKEYERKIEEIENFYEIYDNEKQEIVL